MMPLYEWNKFSRTIKSAYLHSVNAWTKRTIRIKIQVWIFKDYSNSNKNKAIWKINLFIFSFNKYDKNVMKQHLISPWNTILLSFIHITVVPRDLWQGGGGTIPGQPRPSPTLPPWRSQNSSLGGIRWHDLLTRVFNFLVLGWKESVGQDDVVHVVHPRVIQ